jgi:hypothetical protein
MRFHAISWLQVYRRCFLNPQTDNKTIVIEQTGVAVTLLTYIQKVFCPNLGLHIGHVFCGFPSPSKQTQSQYLA